MAEIQEKAEHRALDQGTVGEQLDSIKWSLLPKEIQQDLNVKWVLSYDSDDGQFEDTEFPELDPEQVAYRAAKQTMIVLLQERLPFYLGSLFHIGRQWKISESLGEEARRLQEEGNLIATSENLITFAKQAGHSFDAKRAQESVIALSGIATRQHEGSLAQARDWWTTWAKEVGELRKLVVKFTEEAPRLREQPERLYQMKWLSTFSVFLFSQQRPSRIRFALREAGIHLHDDADPWPQSATAFLTAPLVLAIAGLGSHYGDRWRDYMDDWRYQYYDYRRLLRQIEIEPEIRDAEARLRRRHSNINPFEEFAVGKKAASERLIGLLKESKFVDGVPSRWRSEWEATLEPIYEFAERPSAKEAISPDRVERAIFSADSTIKKGIEESRSPIETFSEFCQRIFEQNWVRLIGYSIFRKTTNAQLRNVWTTTDFQALLIEVVRGLNTLGYKIDVPAETRLRDLASKAERGDRLYPGDW